MYALIILVFVLGVVNIVWGQFLLVKKLIPHWETVLAKKYSLPKYELLELIDKEINSGPFGPWKPNKYKRDCVDIDVPSIYYRPVIIHSVLSMVFLVAWVLLLIVVD